ncbi:ABC transporter permease [Alkalicoccus urumqiensis]|uniref:ABC transporter permease n=1 Tax=Alkalicoccus urumqiensis TaxID=1548213 RepID=A0A2P6MGS2_ALKUR|nr:ABC transporter permease [Alkalicoccus urumqiensis]PRO65488.1 ABC transporter permease [Alkalicoccus urumqiensis]
MNNFWTTFSHTASKRVRTKAFAISTGIMAFLIIALLNIPNIIDMFSDGEEAVMEAVILDDTEFALAEQFQDTDQITYEAADTDPGEAEETYTDGETVIVLSGPLESMEAVLYDAPPAVEMDVQAQLQQVKDQAAAEEADLSEAQLALLQAPVQVSTQSFTDDGGAAPEEAGSGSYWMVYALVFIIYLLVITFGSMIATEVATEKSSRVMELIVSSINPVTQMFGKLFGIGAAGALNLLILGGAAVVGLWMSSEEMLRFIVNDILDVSLLGYALLFIALGYFLYGGVAAMLGALVSRAEEVNQAIQPLIFLAMIAFFLSIMALNAPELTVFRVLSYVPFFTPQLLFLRIGMGTVPGWEIGIIIVLLVLSVVLINLLAARVYKGGVLLYGRFSFKKSVKQALALSRKE